jgi:ABC-type branched-subunit amino acid transport system ATPase component
MGAYSRCEPSFDAAIDRVYAYFPRLKEPETAHGTLGATANAQHRPGADLGLVLLVDEPSSDLRR